MAEEKLVPNRNTQSGKGEVASINILSNEIRLRTEAGSSYVQKLAEDVESRIKRCMADSGIMSSLKAVILVCLELADELEKEKKRHLSQNKAWEEKIEKLLNKIPTV